MFFLQELWYWSRFISQVVGFQQILLFLNLNKFGYLSPAQDNLLDLELKGKIKITFSDASGKEQNNLFVFEVDN